MLLFFSFLFFADRTDFFSFQTHAHYYHYSTTTNYACYEDGSNCVHTEKYVDPSTDVVAMKRRLSVDRKKERNNSNSNSNIRGH